jgi:subtilisin family serine protease
VASHDYLSYGFATGEPPRDLNGHGTHVTGIAAATGNNMYGVAGANWNSPVYVARVLDSEINTTPTAPGRFASNS